MLEQVGERWYLLCQLGHERSRRATTGGHRHPEQPQLTWTLVGIGDSQSFIELGVLLSQTVNGRFSSI